MKASATATPTELGDRLGEVLADRFLYHFVVRPQALRLLGDDDEWGGFSILASSRDHVLLSSP